MWTGEIVELVHNIDPECWTVWIETPDGRLFCDCTTEEIWNTLEYGQLYTLVPNPC